MITITTSQTNIPVKATADTLSASEFNELNSRFNLAAADLKTAADAILNVDNTSDMDKPVSTLQEARIYPVESALENTQIAVLNVQETAAQNAADGAQTRAPMPVATDSGVLTRVAVSTIAPLRGTFNVNKSQIGNDGYTAVQYLVNDGVTPALTATWIKFLD